MWPDIGEAGMVMLAYVSALHFKRIVHAVDGEAALVDEVVDARVALELQLGCMTSHKHIHTQSKHV